MSREIKFRAWHKNREEWVAVSAHYGFDTEGNVYQTNWKPIVLMQYTGLKDKNGVEIYEGDIVRVKPKSKWKTLFIVDWWNDGWVVKVQHKVGYRRLGDFTYQGEYVKNPLCEVIGNIYENPDLLEGQK